MFGDVTPNKHNTFLGFPRSAIELFRLRMMDVTGRLFDLITENESIEGLLNDVSIAFGSWRKETWAYFCILLVNWWRQWLAAESLIRSDMQVKFQSFFFINEHSRRMLF